MLRRSLVLLVATALVGACGGSDDESRPSDAQPNGGELVVHAANYDLAADEKTRFIAGVLTQDQLFVSYGEVEMAFFYLGT